MSRKSQSSLEYLITVGFITFLVISIILISYIYTGILREKIKENQVESFANKVVSTAESVFYAGEPSKTTLEVYLPPGVTGITIINDSLIMNYSAGSAENVRAYPSKVNITGSINPAPGTKRLILEAKTNYVDIHQ